MLFRSDRAKVTLRRILVRFIPLARTPYPFKPVSERVYYAAFSTRKGNDEGGIKSQPAFYFKYIMVVDLQLNL